MTLPPDSPATPDPDRPGSPAAHDVSRETALDEASVRDALLARYPAGADELPAYAELLADVGTARGLIGPRESERLWSRHLANCAVVADLCPGQARVVDVGSGAGLPGLALAIVRPDLRLLLVEPLLRRTVFLQEVVDELGLGERVSVHRGRAEDLARTAGAAGLGDVVTARAVAPLERLVGWCLSLVPIGGALLALKGESAAQEARTAAAAIAAAGGAPPELLSCGGDGLPRATVVRVRRERPAR